MAVITTDEFAHIRLTVTDIARSKEFYDRIFGWPVVIDTSDRANDPGVRQSSELFFGGVVYRLPTTTAERSSRSSTQTGSRWNSRPNDHRTETKEPDSAEYRRPTLSATLTRCQVKPEHLDEHRRLLDAIFAATDADGFTFKVFQFDDEVTHLHVMITHDDVDDPDDLHDMPSYLAVAEGWFERCDEPPAPSGATVLGGWR